MMEATSESNVPRPALSPVESVQLRQLPDLSGLVALFWLTLRQHARGRRLLVLAFLFTLPVALVVLVRKLDPQVRAAEIEFAIVFHLIPHALVPLTALLYASAMIQDEVEEQTLTYLLIRPLPRWALYLTKLLATLAVTAILAGVFTTATYVAIYWGHDDFWWKVFPLRALKASLLLSLSLVGYCAIFGCISLFTSRTLAAGIGFIIIFEGILANIDFAVRRMTVMYYFRVLSLRWLAVTEGLSGVSADPWSLNLARAPGGWMCVVTVLAL
ncbi:MAG: ABC transporter permease subunit, partial [Planctomycetes bacterium]|nr:ABC transporter permease subunit [Planctomycetota bacterium]